MKVDFDFRPYMANIYHCTLVRLRATDIDQEVKERAISCMSVRSLMFIVLLHICITKVTIDHSYRGPRWRPMLAR